MRGSLNISNGGQARLGVRSRKATGLVCSGVQPSFASGLLLRGAGWQPPGIRPNLLFEEGCLQCLLHCLKNEVAVKSAMPHYCFRIAWAGLPSCDQRPQSSSSLPGKRLQTRVSCTAGVESISSQLFEGTLRDKYGKTPRVQEVWPDLGDLACPATGLEPRNPCQRYWGYPPHTPGLFVRMACRAAGLNRTKAAPSRGGRGAPALPLALPKELPH